MSNEAFDIAVIGAGFAGSAVAIHLARSLPPGARVLLLGTPGETGRGLAYSASSSLHLLNVRAARMSLFREDPDHFVRWLCAEGLAAGDPAQFYARRRDYGRYVETALRAALAARRGGFVLAEDRAGALERGAAAFAVRTEAGKEASARHVVLAIGHGPLSFPAGTRVAPGASARMIADPWTDPRMAAIGPEDRILFVGSSQTMADHAVALDATGHRGAMLAVSRHGRLPESQLRRQSDPNAMETEPADLSVLYRNVVEACREEIRRGGDWRAVIDGLRPLSQRLWTGLTLAERRRFIRHAEAVWLVHRSRLAPAIGERIGGLRASGRLAIRAARLEAVARAPGGGVAAALRPRGAAEAEAARFDWVVNCSGVGRLRADAMEPLLSRLLADGLARLHPVGRGVDMLDDHTVVGRDGKPVAGLHALGTLAGGHFFESVAVPELAEHAATLARKLA